MRLKIFITFALSLMFLALYIYLEHASRKDIIKLGTNLWPGYELLYLAREKGYLPEDVKLVEYNTTSEVIRAYRNGVINALALTLDEALRLLEEGYQVKVVLIFDISNGADVVIAQDYIKDAKELKGKSIGVENTALGAYMLTRFLETHGLNENDVKIVPLELQEHYRAFAEGRVDAVITFEPEKSKILKEGGRVIFSSKDIPGEVMDVLVVDEKVAKDRALLKKLLVAYFKAYRYFMLNREEAYRIMANREGISTKELKRVMEELMIPNHEENLKMFSSGLFTKNLERICFIMKEKGMLSKRTDCLKIFDENLLKEVLANAGA